MTQALRRTTETGRPYIIECQMHQKFGPVDYLLNGKTGYLLRRALRYEIAQVSPRMHTKFLTAVRRGRILSDLRRRIRQVLPRRVVTQAASSRWEDCVDMTGKSTKSASWGWLGRLGWPRNVRHNALESQEYHVKTHGDYWTGPTNGLIHKIPGRELAANLRQRAFSKSRFIERLTGSNRRPSDAARPALCCRSRFGRNLARRDVRCLKAIAYSTIRNRHAGGPTRAGGAASPIRCAIRPASGGPQI